MKRRILGLVLLGAMLACMMLAFLSCGEASKVNSSVDNTLEEEILNFDILIDIDAIAGYNAEHYRTVKSVLYSTVSGISREESRDYGSDLVETTYIDGEYAYLPNGEKQPIIEYSKYNTVYHNLGKDLLIKLPSELFKEDNTGYKPAKIDEAGGKLRIWAFISNDNQTEQNYFYSMYNALFSNLQARVREYASCEECRQNGVGCQKCRIENFELEDCNFEITIKDGRVVSATVGFDSYMDIGEEGTDVSFCGKMQININSPVSQGEVSLPKEVEKYPLAAPVANITLRDILK